MWFFSTAFWAGQTITALLNEFHRVYRLSRCAIALLTGHIAFGLRAMAGIQLVMPAQASVEGLAPCRIVRVPDLSRKAACGYGWFFCRASEFLRLFGRLKTRRACFAPQHTFAERRGLPRILPAPAMGPRPLADHARHDLAGCVPYVPGVEVGNALVVQLPTAGAFGIAA